MKGLKKIYGIALGFTSFCTFVYAKPKVSISIWADTGNIPLVEKRLEDFKAVYAKEAIFNFTVLQQSSSTCGTTVLANPELAADIFTFADDQFKLLMNKKLLLQVTDNPERVIEENGGMKSNLIKNCTQDGKLYAYPELTGNGYFLYYNKKYISNSDAKSMDKILDSCIKNGKKFTMDMKNGWYLYSFFKGAGLDVYENPDGSNFCNWNATNTKISGLEVAKGILRIANNPGFICLENEEFVKQVSDGEIVAAINGAWNANFLSKQWGKDFGATKLPTYTVKGSQAQMASFSGYKLVGIKANTEYPEWAMKVAMWLTNAKSQNLLFEATGECPANTILAASPIIQKSPAVMALSEQAKYSTVQRVGLSYWDPSRILGVVLSEGGNMSDSDIQMHLDTTVRKIKTGK